MARVRLVSPVQGDLHEGRGSPDDIIPVQQAGAGRELTPEFCVLIHDADAYAANDNYYVTSANFLELHSNIRRRLVRGLLTWAIGLLAATAILGFVYG